MLPTQTMRIRLIIWLTFCWLPLVMFLIHRNETKFKKNLVVGVTLPFQARTDTGVRRLLDRFVRQILWLNLLMFLITIPFYFIQSVPFLTSVWMIWLLLVICLPMIAYIRTNGALKRLKLERGWKKQDDQTLCVDLSALPSAKWITPWAFILAIVLSFLPLLWDRMMAPLYLVFGLTTLVFWFGYRYLYRNKSEMIDQNIKLTRVLTQVRRHNWGKVWLISAYGFAALSLIFSLLKHVPILQVAAIIVVTMILAIAAIRVEFRTRQIQAQLTAESGKTGYVDDDDHWLGGVVYYNPNDSRLLVHSRVGINSTFNLARTSGKVLACLITLVLLAMPFTGVFRNVIERQPLSLELTDRLPIAHRGGKNETLDLAEITEIRLFPELPQNMTRNWGNSMDRLLSGNFSVPGIGRMPLSLDPHVPPFLLVGLENGSHYLIGSRQPGEAEAVYRQLKK